MLGCYTFTVGRGVSLKIGVASFFATNRCRGTVAGEDDYVIIQLEKLLLDPGEEKFPIATGQVPAPHATLEEHISAHQCLRGWHIVAEAVRTVAGYVKELHFHAEDVLRVCFVEQEGRSEGLDFQLKAPAAEEIPISYHRSSLWMESDLTAVAANDGGRVRDMVKVSVGEQEQGNRGLGICLVCSLRGIEKDVPTGCGIEKTVGIEHSARKHFELIHRKRVLQNMSKFDFMAQLCKFFARR